MSYLIDECLGHFPQYIRGDLGYSIGVLADQPQDTGLGQRYCDVFNKAGQLTDDLFVLARLE